jgi:ABC-type dipeptide/oligopeptide/nickel transport system permease component
MRPSNGDDTATAVVVANLLADVVYAWLDPRITD